MDYMILQLEDTSTWTTGPTSSAAVGFHAMERGGGITKDFLRLL